MFMGSLNLFKKRKSTILDSDSAVKRFPAEEIKAARVLARLRAVLGTSRASFRDRANVPSSSV